VESRRERGGGVGLNSAFQTLVFAVENHRPRARKTRCIRARSRAAFPRNLHGETGHQEP